MFTKLPKLPVTEFLEINNQSRRFQSDIMRLYTVHLSKQALKLYAHDDLIMCCAAAYIFSVVVKTSCN